MTTVSLATAVQIMTLRSRAWHGRAKHANRPLRIDALSYLVAALIAFVSSTQLVADTVLEIILVGESDTELAPHREGNVYAPEIHQDGERLLMWYGGQGTDGHDRIHLAESVNGVEFVRRGVVLDCGTANHVNDPSIVRVANTWWMFYTVAQSAEDDQIAAAVSSDGVNWERKGIVVSPSGSAAWDSRKVGRPSVLYENGVFRMWYDGQPTTAASEADEVAARVRRQGRAVGYAESTDGLRWTKREVPVMYDGAGAVHVVNIRNRYVMTGESRQGTWWAESDDGLAWQRRGWLTQMSGEASDRHGQVTPYLLQTLDHLTLYFGAAARASWDGNRIARMKVTLPSEGR
jgi:hypothetical protein